MLDLQDQGPGWDQCGSEILLFAQIVGFFLLDLQKEERGCPGLAFPPDTSPSAQQDEIIFLDVGV